MASKQSKKTKKQLIYLKRFNCYSQLLNNRSEAADNAFIMLIEQNLALGFLEEDINFEALESRYIHAKERERVYQRGTPTGLAKQKQMLMLARERWERSQPWYIRFKMWLIKLINNATIK